MMPKTPSDSETNSTTPQPNQDMPALRTLLTHVVSFAQKKAKSLPKELRPTLPIGAPRTPSFSSRKTP